MGGNTTPSSVLQVCPKQQTYQHLPLLHPVYSTSCRLLVNLVTKRQTQHGAGSPYLSISQCLNAGMLSVHVLQAAG